MKVKEKVIHNFQFFHHFCHLHSLSFTFVMFFTFVTCVHQLSLLSPVVTFVTRCSFLLIYVFVLCCLLGSSVKLVWLFWPQFLTFLTFVTFITFVTLFHFVTSEQTLGRCEPEKHVLCMPESLHHDGDDVSKKFIQKSKSSCHITFILL